MGRIGVEVAERRHHPARKRADFRLVLHHENDCDTSTESCAEERPSTHARSGSTFDWRDVDWSDCQRRVRSLQSRIVKAWQEGRRRKARALQRLLVRSLSGKALAVRRVTENQGRRTPGVDHELWSTPETKSQAVLSLGRRGYQPRPLRRVYIPKSNGKMRPLGIPTMKDRAMQALYLLALEPIAECKADRNSYGFRPKRSVADAIEQCWLALSKNGSALWILEGDIKGCFDNISHDWLIANAPTDKTILRKWLKAGFIESNALWPTEAGTPQGGIISPTLANIALDGLEAELRRHFRQPAKVNFVRYADDFIITGRSKELLEDEVKPLVAEFLRIRGLDLSQEKTSITHIEQGFDFLGHNVRKYRNGKVLTKPSRQGVISFLRRARALIKANKAATQADLIVTLNPLLRGWANFYQHAVAKEVFRRVDHEVWKAIWRWALRRHPKKRKRWVRRRYFSVHPRDSWWFCTKRSGMKGERRELFKLRRIPIRRHIKVKAEANPFDTRWELYFERREERRIVEAVNRRTRILWRRQQGRCPVCAHLVTLETGWHTHHVIWKVQGGSDRLDNLALLHPTCHRQVHRSEKPSPCRALHRALARA
jgi:RNA-directed DNA polymerase